MAAPLLLHTLFQITSFGEASQCVFLITLLTLFGEQDGYKALLVVVKSGLALQRL